MMILLGFVLSLVVQNVLEYQLYERFMNIVLHRVVASYGYMVRPLILLLFIHIVSPGKKHIPEWSLICVNTALYMASIFRRICFWIDDSNLFYNGIWYFRYTCMAVSTVLLLMLLWDTIRKVSPVRADIDNLIGLSGVSVATMVGAAHAQDVYDARVKLSGGEYDMTDVKVNTTSDIQVKSNVTPSDSGISISAASVGVNSSTATSTAYAGSELVLENAKLNTGNVDVNTTTSTLSEAIVRPASFSLSAIIDVGSNKVTSEVNGTQAATLRLKKGEVTVADQVNVQSLVKKADSKATVSTSGTNEENKSRVKLGIISTEANTALAKESLASTAGVIGEGSPKKTVYYDVYYLSNGRFLKRANDQEYGILLSNPYTRYIYRIVPVEVEEGQTFDGNRITAGRLTILAGTDEATGASAYTQGAYQAGIYTAGNLDG